MRQSQPALRAIYSTSVPDRARMAEIVANHLGIATASANPFLENALALFYTLREPASGLRKTGND